MRTIGQAAYEASGLHAQTPWSTLAERVRQNWQRIALAAVQQHQAAGGDATNTTTEAERIQHLQAISDAGEARF